MLGQQDGNWWKRSMIKMKVDIKTISSCIREAVIKSVSPQVYTGFLKEQPQVLKVTHDPLTCDFQTQFIFQTQFFKHW